MRAVGPMKATIPPLTTRWPSRSLVHGSRSIQQSTVCAVGSRRPRIPATTVSCLGWSRGYSTTGSRAGPGFPGQTVEEWYEPDEGGSPESSGGRIRCEVKGIGHPTSDAATAAWVTIENPTRANSVNSTLLGALANVFRRLASRDETLRCVVLTGGASPDDKGAAAFCGGADIREMSSLTTTGGARSFITAVHEACRAVRELEVVTVARIDGVTFGAGLEIAAACDFRYATGTSHFGMPEVALGIPSVVEARLLANIVGWQKTKELVYFGRVIDAATAASWGLVDGVDDNLDSLVYPTLSGIAANGPRAMRAQKRLVQTWEDCDLQAGIAAGVDSFAGMWDDGGVEPKKYMGAFLEQRRAKKAGGK